MWSLFSGQKTLALYLGIFFELFWIDLFPAGTFIPPQSVYAIFFTLSISYILGLEKISYLLPLIIATNIFSYIGVFIERKSRLEDNYSYNNLLKKLKSKEELNVSFVIFKSIARSIIYNFIFFFLSLIVLFNFFKIILPYIPNIEFINWNTLWLVALLGGVLSLRIQKYYFVFGIGILFLGIIYLLI